MNNSNRLTIADIDAFACTGCGLCSVICPKNCISMEGDQEGFAAPQIDMNNCIACGLCYEKCQVVCGKTPDRPLAEGYMAIYNNLPLPRRSSSGGVFFALAKWVFTNRDGVVAGARMLPDGRVVHVLARDDKELRLLQGSKYVQSRIENALIECKEEAKRGRTILFCGTPCQVAAVKSYLDNDDCLITCELICHGVPSPSLWAARVAELRSENGITDFSNILFRISNRENRTLYCIADGDAVISRGELDWYYSLFLCNESLRECCYSCPHAGEYREADLLIGDCASSVGDYEFHPQEPVSTVFALSEKGRWLLSEILSSCCDMKKLDETLESQLNKQLAAPTLRPESRSRVYEDFNSLEFDEFVDRYSKPPSIKYYVKETLKKLLPVKVRVEIRKALQAKSR